MDRKFNIGDRVELKCEEKPRLTGTIRGYYKSNGFTGEGNWWMYNIIWDQDTPYAVRNTQFAETNLKLLKRGDMIIKLKPIQYEAEIAGGNWTHVVISNNTKKIVAAFTNEEDATQYIDYGFEHDDYTIREVEQ